MDDVTSAADPAVEVDLGRARHSGHHLRQRRRRARQPVELPAAVVRHPDGVRSGFDRAARVDAGHHPLHDNGPAPDLLQPAEVRPHDCRVEQLVDDVEHPEPLTYAEVGRGEVAHGQAVPDELAHGLPPEPACVAQQVARLRQARPRRHGEPVAQVALPARRDRDVDGQDERAITRGTCALHHPTGQVAVPPDVELEPHRPGARVGDVLQAPREGRAQGRDDVRGRRCLRGSELTAGVHHRCQTHRSEHDRRADGGAQQRRGLTPVGHVGQRARNEGQLLQRLPVAPDRQLVLSAAFDEVEHRLRQAARGQSLHVVHTALAPQAHPHADHGFRLWRSWAIRCAAALRSRSRSLPAETKTAPSAT